MVKKIKKLESPVENIGVEEVKTEEVTNEETKVESIEEKIEEKQPTREFKLADAIVEGDNGFIVFIGEEEKVFLGDKVNSYSEAVKYFKLKKSL